MSRLYKTGRFHQEVEIAKIRILREALRRNNGNRTRTALELDLGRPYLHRLIKTLGVEERRRIQRDVAPEAEGGAR